MTKACPSASITASLAREARERVEAAMVAAICAPSSAPASSRSGDRLGRCRSGHSGGRAQERQAAGAADRARQPSLQRAVQGADLVPANRWEVVECHAALEAVRAHDLDGDAARPRPSRRALPAHPDRRLCRRLSMPMRFLPRSHRPVPMPPCRAPNLTPAWISAPRAAMRCRAYDRWQRLMLRDGLWSLRDPRAAQMIRMNIGTITDTETLKVRLKSRFGGRPWARSKRHLPRHLPPATPSDRRRGGAL